MGPFLKLTDCSELILDLSLQEEFSPWFSTKSVDMLKNRKVNFKIVNN